MAKKIVKILYNPYQNHIQFNISLDAGETWQDLAENSGLLKYQNQDCGFSNCVEDIIHELNQYHNSTPDGLRVKFIGTDDDYRILRNAIADQNKLSKKKGKISAERAGSFRSADEAIAIIRKAYFCISDEFNDYLPGNAKYEKDATCTKIGDTISRFNETVSREIPICIIGTYSVGKSAFINAIIGAEVLPSKVDPCTAKNVKVETSSEVYVEFEYKQTVITYKVIDGGVEVIDKAQEYADSFSEVLKTHCTFDGKNSAEVLHDILVAFNEREESFSEVAEIGWNIIIRLPFSQSILNQDECRIVIYDTPGSNNSDVDQKEHRESLEKMMGEQTNALPIFVMDRNQVISNDNNEVKSLLDDNRKGFSNPNCLIVFSKAENIPNSAFNQAIPPAFLNWHGKATFLYICAVGAIGAKKKSQTWIDPEYQDGYNDWKLKYNSDHRQLPTHNIIPCGRTMDAKTRRGIPDELFATGIPSVEDEINYYILRYANYKKCVNGRELLLSALSLAAKQLEDQKKDLAEAKKNKEEEQKKKKKQLTEALEAVKIKSVNIRYVINKYQTVLNAYCDTVLPEIKRIWSKASRSGDLTQYIRHHMQVNCTDNLFKPAYEGDDGIQNEVVAILLSCASEYKAELKAIVDEKESDLSQEAQSELDKIFEEIKTPSFQKVSLNGNGVFRLASQLPLIGSLFEEKYKESLAADICRQLKHQDGGWFHPDKLGLFAEQCIQQPVSAYFNQLKTWQKTHLGKIESTLDKDNAILSQYDALIIDLQEQITNLGKRLDNLNDVSDELENVLESDEGVEA